MQEITDSFNAAATNEDKLLNEAQFVEFSQKLRANNRAKGWDMPETTDEECKRGYVIINKITPGADGVSIADIWN